MMRHTGFSQPACTVSAFLHQRQQLRLPERGGGHRGLRTVRVAGGADGQETPLRHRRQQGQWRGT